MTAVSALITVFNEETWIASAVQSLLDQTFDNIEILVIDDGSTDATPEILADIGDPRLRIIRCERKGRAAALALGVSEARGDYVAILDADDEAYPERLEKQVSFLEAQPEVAWIGCGEERRDTQRNETAFRLYPSSDTAIRRMSARCIPYSHSGVMFRRTLTDEGLNYDADIPYLIDFEFFLRVAERHKVANLSEVLIMRRVRGESYFQRSFKRRAQNRALVSYSFSAIRRFKLPVWHAIFPISRLCYDLVPNSLKQKLRRFAGLEERFS